MTDQKKNTDDLFRFLQEREKELSCLYRLEEIINKPDATLEDICKETIAAIPPGWQYSDYCRVKIVLKGSEYESPDFKETPWVQSADIKIQDQAIGKISVYYIEEMPNIDEGPFLDTETKLLKMIADRISHFIIIKKMKQISLEYQTVREHLIEHKTIEWRVVLNLLRRTDKNLYMNITQRMLNYLSWSGFDEAKQLLQQVGIERAYKEDEVLGEENQPHQKKEIILSKELCEKIFDFAEKHVYDNQILAQIQKWIQEDKLNFLIYAVNKNSSLVEIFDAIRRYHHILPEGIELPPSTKKGVEVALIRRLLSNQTQFINIAKNFFEINDFHDRIDHIIHSSESYGQLGGKSAGLLLAEQIIKKASDSSDLFSNIKIPRTWFITSDICLYFLSYNNLGEVVEQKYKDINQIRLEYPHVVQSFKNCRFPPEIIQSLSMVLDELQDCPLIVRSSSLLEDRMGAAFSGKYKSLFIANQGSKRQRLEALTDAIAEVYASVFGPDPIEYRAERELLDFGEEMGIMIQEVVGNKVGDYFIPTFAGVAFSRNEFRWSPRIKREDGLVRMVPGLGTRAVDRVADDYPILIAPGQPGLQVNVTTDEVVRYSPSKIDVVNLKKRIFETIDINDLLRQYGEQIPGINKVISIFDGQQIRKPLGLNIDFQEDDLLVTFDGLVSDTSFVKQIGNVLQLLEDKLETPVDIEFAHDGRNFYLLQCRPQSYSEDSVPSPIPTDIPKEKIVFSANRYISNGRIQDITHIVYVDPLNYSELSDRSLLLSVGRAVGKLNKLLPKRQFILMGPGRWGSRGDIKLGVNVTYSDINNTAMLIEIALKKGNYTPDLSFGTHFFQDLVEAGIRYLPLYPDEKHIIFNEKFLQGSNSILLDVLPDFESLTETVRLIDISKTTGGEILQVLMNADLNEAVGILVEPSKEIPVQTKIEDYGEQQSENYWAWRLQMAENIASQLDPDRFGVKGFYVFGSTKNATARPDSDINIIVHFQGTTEQRKELMLWLDGWSLSLAEMNYQQTGYKTDGLLDIHIITDDDIAQKTSYANKIEAVTDAARPLQLMKRNR